MRLLRRSRFAGYLLTGSLELSLKIHGTPTSDAQETPRNPKQGQTTDDPAKSSVIELACGCLGEGFVCWRSCLRFGSGLEVLLVLFSRCGICFVCFDMSSCFNFLA